MKAAVLETFGSPLSLVDVELSSPKANEVAVEIKATGVCHSDLSVQQGKLPYPLPCVLGHEGAGVVSEVGEGVDNVSPGDRVVVMWTPMCGSCFYCLGGQTHLCEEGQAIGVMQDGTTRLMREGKSIYHGINGATFAEAAVFRSNSVVKVPDDVPFEIAAVIGCGVLTGIGAAVYTAKVRPGDSVAVVGCGGVGMNVIQGACLAGAERIIAVDTAASKLDMARKFGATHSVDVTGRDAATAVQALTDGRGADVAFEVVGRPELQRNVFHMARRGGKAVFVGMAPYGEDVSLPSMLLTLHEKQVLGCYYGSSDPKREIPRILELWKAGRIDLENLISATGRLEDVNTALADMESGRVIRTVLTP